MSFNEVSATQTCQIDNQDQLFFTAPDLGETISYLPLIALAFKKYGIFDNYLKISSYYVFWPY